MATPSVAVIDALNSLLEAEANSIFHFVGAGSPFLNDASPSVREVLDRLTQRLERHSRELEQLIVQLGGEPSHPPAPRAEDQYLSYLSLQFLLPKLVDAKRLMIQRYESALAAVASSAPATKMLQKQLGDIESGMADLKRIAADVAAHR